MKQVSANVYVEDDVAGGNHAFVVTKGGVVMMDTPWTPEDALRWRDEIAKRGDVRYIINGEPHVDHIAQTYLFPGIVISHQGSRSVLAAPPAWSPLTGTIVSKEEEFRASFKATIGRSLPDGFRLKLPDVTFSQQLNLHLGDHIIELIHLPGHCASQIAVYIPQEKVIFAGDNVQHKTPSAIYESLPDQWLESLKRIEEMDVEVIIPGHGEPCDKSYLSVQAAVIHNWLDVVQKAISQGLSRKEAQERLDSPDPHPYHSWITASEARSLEKINFYRIYEYLTKER